MKNLNQYDKINYVLLKLVNFPQSLNISIKFKNNLHVILLQISHFYQISTFV